MVASPVIVLQQQWMETPPPLRGEALARYIVAVADRENLPRRVLLALAYAESTWDAQKRRPVNQSQDPAFWPDVSGGAFQQTVAFSDEFAARGLNPSNYPGAQITEEILSRYFDLDHAARVAARKLRTLLARPDVGGDHLLALFRYNKPNGTPSPQAQQNYRNGLVKTDEFLATLGS